MSAKVAIIATEDNLLLEALLETWFSSALVGCEILLVSPVADSDNTVVCEGRTLFFNDIASFDFGLVSCIVNLTPAIMVNAYKHLLENVKCPVLGFMDALVSLHPVLFDYDIAGDNSVVGIPQAPVAALQYVLKDISVDAIDITVLYPAALYGKQGVQELAAQTTRLLNVQPFEGNIFEQQLPFNYYPMSVNSAGINLEGQLFDEMGMVFPDVESHISSIQLPVFYGVSMLVSVTLQNEVDLPSLQNLWMKKELISYQDSPKQLSNMASLEENGAIILGNLRKSHADNYRIDFWLGIDDVKFSVSHGLISAAEFLLKHHL